MPGFFLPADNEFAVCMGDTKSIADGIYTEGAEYDGPDPLVEYARTYRWLFETLEPFGSGRDSGILLHLSKCSRPSVEFEVLKIHHAQDVIYRPGKNAWSPISMSFYEVVNNNNMSLVADKIYKWWGDSMIDYHTSLHGKVANYQKNATLKMVDGIGRSVWTYNLYNCWISKISPSELNSVIMA